MQKVKHQQKRLPAWLDMTGRTVDGDQPYPVWTLAHTRNQERIPGIGGVSAKETLLATAAPRL